jgi:diadenosine tetraphosphatase ApaH/serine/threonine PP2A family protein phosphatase
MTSEAEKLVELTHEQRPRARCGRNWSLCHCQTFSPLDYRFIEADGRCRYCGGYTPEVFRVHMGEAALHEHIDKLNASDRARMREIVGSGVIVDSTARTVWTNSESRRLLRSA